MNQWEDKDIQFYNRPALGYQVVIFARGSKLLDIHLNLHMVIEYQYGSRYSYPAPNEAGARRLAVSQCVTTITNHWNRMKTRAEARIYPFGGLIRDMRLVRRR
jgi:hypothetical protein